jgi:hypothetical protein
MAGVHSAKNMIEMIVFPIVSLMMTNLTSPVFYTAQLLPQQEGDVQSAEIFWPHPAPA